MVRLFPAALVTDPARRAALERLTHQVIRYHHPGVVKWIEFREISFQNTRYYCLVSRWFSDESLEDWLMRYGPLDEENAILVLHHAVTVLSHFWTNCHVAHGNLKPKNILIDKKDNLKLDGFAQTTLQMLIAPPE